MAEPTRAVAPISEESVFVIGDGSPTLDAFDLHADSYETELRRGLAISGEDPDYFARARLAWFSKCLGQLGVQPSHALDFGCGTGSASPHFFELMGVSHFVGLDPSPRSTRQARARYGSPTSKFLGIDEYRPNDTIDVAYCNGVFHHIPPSDQEAAVDYVYRTLRPGGLFSLWENNPWNPGTRIVMSRIPFDRQAIPLTALESRRLLSRRGFQVLRIDFLFWFPRALSWLRSLEPWLIRCPLGAQYQVLCRKP